ALQAYDSADSTNRKTWELIFGNTANGINWANTVLFFRKQEPLYCPPDDFALTGPQVIEMLRELATSKPKLATVPYDFAILLALPGYDACGWQSRASGLAPPLRQLSLRSRLRAFAVSPPLPMWLRRGDAMPGPPL